MKNKTIAIIPARGGSKRLPNKNIKLLGDIPLLVHSIHYAKANAVFIDEVYVSTDDAAIKKIALEHGAKVIDRPFGISGDNEPTVSALKHVVESIDDAIDYVVLLQATNPLRPVNLLRDCFAEMNELGVDSLFTVSRNQEKLGEIVNNQFQPYNYIIGQRSQDLKPLYFENGLLYISKVNLIQQNLIISAEACPFEVNHPYSTVDIDTIEDFDYAAYLYNKK